METLFSFKYMRVLVALLLGMLILMVFASASQVFNWTVFQGNYATINVEGVAEVNAVPDIGAFSFSVEAEGDDVGIAQEESGKKINAIMEYLKNEGGVEEKDIKTTGYNAYPRYEYVLKEDCVFGRCDKKRELVGYTVTQQVAVKVRDTGNAGNLIGGVGSLGATNMSGLSFEVDDLEALKEEARLAAITDAKAKGKRLAKELGVRLGDILSFNDGGGDKYPVPYAPRSLMSDERAFEGGFSEQAFAPEISVGEDTVVARVTITYKIK